MTQWKIFNKGLLSLSITAATYHHKADMETAEHAPRGVRRAPPSSGVQLVISLFFYQYNTQYAEGK